MRRHDEQGGTKWQIAHVVREEAKQSVRESLFFSICQTKREQRVYQAGERRLLIHPTEPVACSVLNSECSPFLSDPTPYVNFCVYWARELFDDGTKTGHDLAKTSTKCLPESLQWKPCIVESREQIQRILWPRGDRLQRNVQHHEGSHHVGVVQLPRLPPRGTGDITLLRPISPALFLANKVWLYLAKREHSALNYCT